MSSNCGASPNLIPGEIYQSSIRPPFQRFTHHQQSNAFALPGDPFSIDRNPKR